MIQKVLILLLALVVCQTLQAQQDAFSSDWKRYVLEETDEDERSTAHYYLYQYENVSDLEQLRKQGWILVRKLDKRSSILLRPSTQVGQRLSLSVAMFPVNNEWKLSPNLIADQLKEEQIDLALKSLDTQKTLQFLEANGVSRTHVRGSAILINSISTALLSELQQRREVIYIGAESQQAVFDSRVLDMNLNPNKVNLIHRYFPNLKGQGMVLSIKENGYNTEDLDLVTRDMPSVLSAETNSNHATEMATIAAGAGNSSLNGQGVADRATLTSSFLEQLLPDASADYQALNVGVQNHSYGTSEIENFYGLSAEAYDQVANENPTLLHVFSVGNLGESIPEEGAYSGLSGFANLSGNFKASKNTLSVGSVDTVGRKVGFVSNGPAHDGRIKPELVAYSVFGSSNSAALTAGVATVLQQAYQDREGVLPPSALIKALLINGAKDVEAEGPDYLTGFGNLDAYSSLQMLNAGQYASGSLTQSEVQETIITVPAGTAELKVTLVWNDPAAAANANLALVNDLDMVLEDAQAAEWQPWVLNPLADRLTAVAQRGQDQLNNVEQITIANPVAGEVRVKVRGTNISQGPQAYHLTWQWRTAEQFDWTFPSANDNMPYNGETTGYFRWESSLQAGTGSLEYSTNEGMNWQVIDVGIDLTTGQYRWESPDLKTSAIARMVVGAQVFESETFTISRPDRIGVGFSCADSVRLHWSPQEGVTQYEILTLDGAAMREIGNTRDTAFTFTKSDFATRFFAVQPVLDNGARPVRSATFDYDFQGVGCYIISLSTELLGEEGVYVNVNLGTTAGVQEIEFQRQIEMGDWQPFLTINGDAQGENIRVLDTDAFQGLNNYRASLLFENGERLLSGESSAYFLTTRPFLVFPNPLPRGDRLNVFSRPFEDEQEVTLTLYDRSGLKAFDLTLNSDRFAFDLSDLPAGLYTYRIVTEGINQTGRVIINQ